MSEAVMARRSRLRQVEIFNFSFLDILACTIGLLIFIMVMVFILQSGSPVADTTVIVGRKSDEAQRYRESAGQDAAITAQLEQQLSRIHDSISPDLRIAREIAATQNESRRSEYDRALERLRAVEIELDRARSEQKRTSESDLQRAEAVLKGAHERYEAAKSAIAKANKAPTVERLRFLPSQKASEVSEDYQILHVDCRADSVVFLESDPEGNMRESERCSPGEIAEKGSAFQRAIYEHSRLEERPLVLLWVRPDGIDTFNRVRHALPEALPYGFEPADADWHFEAARHP